MGNIKPISYLQVDPRWKSKPYRVEGKESSTIGSAGCGPTCAAMIIATLTDSTVTPVDTCNWSMKNGFKAVNQGTFYTYFAPQLAKYGIKSVRLNTSSVYKKPNNSVHNTALEALKVGHWLICCMGPGNWTKGGHFILVYGYKDGNVLINDPASTSYTRIENTWEKLKNEVKYYFDITIPGNVDKDTTEVVETVDDSKPLYWGICTGNNVNIRAGKGLLTKSLGKANKGEGMTCDPNSSNKNWIKVYHAGLGLSGYMSAKYIKKEANKEEVKNVNKKVDKSNEIYWGICTGNNVHLRAGKGRDTESLGKVNKGEGMTCSPAESSDSWIKVYHAGLCKSGYVAARYIKR